MSNWMNRLLLTEESTQWSPLATAITTKHEQTKIVTGQSRSGALNGKIVSFKKKKKSFCSHPLPPQLFCLLNCTHITWLLSLVECRKALIASLFFYISLSPTLSVFFFHTCDHSTAGWIYTPSPTPPSVFLCLVGGRHCMLDNVFVSLPPTPPHPLI